MCPGGDLRRLAEASCAEHNRAGRRSKVLKRTSCRRILRFYRQDKQDLQDGSTSGLRKVFRLESLSPNLSGLYVHRQS